MPIDQQRLVEAYDILVKRLGERDLHALCFRMGLEFDDLGGAGKTDKLRELLTFLDRRERIADLIKAGQAERPDILWDTILGGQTGTSTNQSRLPSYPYTHFVSRFRDVIAPISFQPTGSVLNIVFGNIAEIEHTNVVIPINQDFDFWQRGWKSVLASFENVTVDHLPFFDALEVIWPDSERPKSAGIGCSRFLRLPKDSSALNGIIWAVTTRNLSDQSMHYGRYVNTPLEGVDFVLDNVLRCAQDERIESLALPLLGTGYANIGIALDHPQLHLLIRQFVAGLSIKKLQDLLTDRECKLRRGILVLYSSSRNSPEENQLWNFVVRFVGADHPKRAEQLALLARQLGEFSS